MCLEQPLTPHRAQVIAGRAVGTEVPTGRGTVETEMSAQDR